MVVPHSSVSCPASALVRTRSHSSTLVDSRHQSPLLSAEQLLLRYWQYPSFRFHQRKAVLAPLLGRDCLVVLPTGGGKSLCFQIPGMLLPGITLVVSPLISLMQDQVAALRARGIAAAYVSSTQKCEAQRSVWEAVSAGRIKLLYVAPERLDQLPGRLRGLEVSFLAVDEAHCISEWGHDFRPHYRTLGKCRRFLGGPPTMAVTATATPGTRDDVVAVLGLRRPVRIIQSFDRPNLVFEVQAVRSESHRAHLLMQLLRSVPGTAVVYVPTRNWADGVATTLRQCGFSALPYHAGLPGSARKALLDRFLAGRCRVMVATSAFGMGIDKPDVRLVVHLGVPARPEAYFQEAGRAGRDGQHARCVLLWTEDDLRLTAKMALAGDMPNGSPASAAHRKATRTGWHTMRRYVRTRTCRRRLLLDYLGEQLRHCSGCDRCGTQL